MVTILPDTISQSLGTLVAGVALIVGNAYDNDQLTERGFLLKKTIIHGLIAQDMTAADGPLLFGCGRGDLNVSQLADATTEIQKVPSTEVQGKIMKIFRESLMYVPLAVEGQNPLTTAIKWGGGKGIPLNVEKGMVWFVINRDGNDLQTGGVLKAEMTHFGVWL